MMKLFFIKNKLQLTTAPLYYLTLRRNQRKMINWTFSQLPIMKWNWQLVAVDSLEQNWHTVRQFKMSVQKNGKVRRSACSCSSSTHAQPLPPAFLTQGFSWCQFNICIPCGKASTTTLAPLLSPIYEERNKCNKILASRY